MTGEYCHIDSGLSKHFRDAFWGVVQLQFYGRSAVVTYFDLLSGLPTMARLTPGQVVEFVDGCAYTNLQGQNILLLYWLL